MIYRIIQILNDSLTTSAMSSAIKVVAADAERSISFWFWIALVEFLVISLLIFRARKRKKYLDFIDVPDDVLKKAKSSDIDMGDLMQSINESKAIYKELSKLCHPDRFLNSEKHENALAIFQEISKNKRNYKELSNLRERAITELEIKIN
jgi:hypothetical protein